MRSTAIILLLSAFAFRAGAAMASGLKEAMQNGTVRVTATTTANSYNGKALRLEINNTSRNRLQVTIDPALIFRPEEEGYQHLVLPAEEMLAIAPGATAAIEVQTFCGKMHAMSPGAGLSYKFLKQGDSSLIKVTQYIRKNRLYDYLGQQAIWAITDKTDLEGVIDPNRSKQSAELLALLVNLTGRPVPPYFKMYKLDTTAGQPVFRKRVLKIVSNMEWKLQEPASISLGIYNAAGDLVQGVLDEKPMAKGGYRMQVQFEAEGAPPGKYYLRLKDKDKLLQEQIVSIE